MTAPVPVHKHTVVFGTRRVRRGYFRLLPEELREAIKYLAIYYARRYDIELWAFIILGNHIHWIGLDRHGRYPDFVRDLHMRIQEVVCAHFGIEGRLWAAERPRTLRCIDTELSRLLYVVTNAVKHGLVDLSTNWPGLLFSPENAGQKIPAICPKILQDRYNSFPPTLTYTVPIPHIVGPATHDMCRREFARLRQAHEAKLIARREEGKPALDVAAALSAGPWDHPAEEPERTPFRPFACKPGQESACLEALSAWRRTYHRARRDYTRGSRNVEWPAGTYAMHHWHKCPRCDRDGP